MMDMYGKMYHHTDLIGNDGEESSPNGLNKGQGNFRITPMYGKNVGAMMQDDGNVWEKLGLNRKLKGENVMEND